MNTQFSEFKNSLPFLKYVVKKLKQLPVIADFIVGKGRDLTASERAIVHSKIKQFWSYEKKQIKHGKSKLIRISIVSSVVMCSIFAYFICSFYIVLCVRRIYDFLFILLKVWEMGFVNTPYGIIVQHFFRMWRHTHPTPNSHIYIYSIF